MGTGDLSPSKIGGEYVYAVTASSSKLAGAEIYFKQTEANSVGGMRTVVPDQFLVERAEA